MAEDPIIKKMKQLRRGELRTKVVTNGNSRKLVVEVKQADRTNSSRKKPKAV